jgi:hypothetical protein
VRCSLVKIVRDERTGGARGHSIRFSRFAAISTVPPTTFPMSAYCEHLEGGGYKGYALQGGHIPGHREPLEDLSYRPSDRSLEASINSCLVNLHLNYSKTGIK